MESRVCNDRLRSIDSPPTRDLDADPFYPHAVSPNKPKEPLESCASCRTAAPVPLPRNKKGILMHLEFKIKNPKSPVSRSAASQRFPLFPRNHFVLTWEKEFLPTYTRNNTKFKTFLFLLTEARRLRIRYVRPTTFESSSATRADRVVASREVEASAAEYREARVLIFATRQKSNEGYFSERQDSGNSVQPRRPETKARRSQAWRGSPEGFKESGKRCRIDAVVF